jgi:excinuclease ABC subunit C
MKTGEVIAKMPCNSGVYIFKGPGGRILYVGKAKRLRDRVRSHFSGSHDSRHSALISEVESVDFIVTSSEVDALVLEANLVRDRQPYYNVNLKDDKRYPYLKVTLQEEYPRLLLTRNAARDGSRHFGPYTDVKSLRGTMKLLRSVFPLRTCGDLKKRQRLKKDCLSLHIDRCCGPCVYRVTVDEYRRLVNELLLFLSGKNAAVIDRLEKSMAEASSRREYEKCALLRNRIAAVKRVPSGRRVVDLGDPEMDVLGLARDGDTACVSLLKVRDGKVLDQVRRFLDCGGATSPEEILTSFIEQYYVTGPDVPPRIAIPVKLERPELLESWLGDLRGARVKLKVPQRGVARRLVEMAGRNAALAQGARVEKKLENDVRALEELQEALGLQSLPYVIDCYDISNTSGTNAVGARVVFVGGVPEKARYRKYKVRGRESPNDTAMLGEVVERSLARRVREGEEPPDLLLVDGGKGQVSAAVEAAARVGLETVPVAGLAKADELVYLPGRSKPVALARRSASLRLLQRLRDEAHRFGVTFHRTRRGSEQLKTLLDGVSGIGPQRRRLLLRKFGSAEGVMGAAESDIASLPGLGPMTARKIKRALRARIGGGGRA